MNEETQTIEKTATTTTEVSDRPNESKAFNMSIRAWIAILLTVAFCVMTILQRAIDDKFNFTYAMVIAFYFAQNKSIGKG